MPVPNVPGRCLVDTCQEKAAKGCRGLCMKDYSEAKKAVESGQTTWDELTALGMVEAVDTKFGSDLRNRRANAAG